MQDPPETFGAVDWATETHAACVVDERGAVVDEFDIDHTSDGLRTLCQQFVASGARRIAIERPDGPIEPTRSWTHGWRWWSWRPDR